MKVRIKGQGDSYLLLRSDGVNLTVRLDVRVARAMEYKASATPSGSIISIHDKSHSCLLQMVRIIRGPLVGS